MQTLRGEFQGLQEEMEAQKRRQGMATSCGAEDAILAGNADVGNLLGSAWSPWQAAPRPRSVVSESVAA